MSPRSRSKLNHIHDDAAPFVLDFGFVDASIEASSSLKRKLGRVPLSDHTNHPEYKRARKLFQKIEESSIVRSKEDGDNVNLLPNEVLLAIFKLLPALAKGRLVLVCKRWTNLVTKAKLYHSFDIDHYGMLIKNSMRHNRTICDYIKRKKHPELTVQMRSTLVDWIVEVGEEFKMHSDTIFLTVAFIDRYLSLCDSKDGVPKTQFQLLGVSSLLIASKFEEMSAPTIGDLVFICDHTYTAREIIAMEASILNTLGFDINIFTTRRFAQHMLNVTFEREPKVDIPTKLVMTSVTNYLMEVSLLDHVLSQQKPSRIAAAAICLARISLNYSVWPSYLKEETFYCVNDLIPVCKRLFEFVTEGTKYQAAFIKYSQSQHQKVSSHQFKQFWTN